MSPSWNTSVVRWDTCIVLTSEDFCFEIEVVLVISGDHLYYSNQVDASEYHEFAAPTAEKFRRYYAAHFARQPKRELCFLTFRVWEDLLVCNLDRTLPRGFARLSFTPTVPRSEFLKMKILTGLGFATANVTMPRQGTWGRQMFSAIFVAWLMPRDSLRKWHSSQRNSVCGILSKVFRIFLVGLNDWRGRKHRFWELGGRFIMKQQSILWLCRAG